MGHPSRLGSLVTFAYSRYDGEASVGRSSLYRRFWEFVGDRADDLRCAWWRRPKVEQR